MHGTYDKKRFLQEAQLPHRDRATRYASKFVLFVSRGIAAKTFQTAIVTFKVIQGHRQWCHSIGNMRFPIIDLHCNYVAILHRFRDIITYFPKLKEVL